MSDGADANTDKMAEVLRLSTELSRRVLDARLADETVAPEQSTALIRAARLLEDSNLPFPEVLTQALQELAHHLQAAGPGEDGAGEQELGEEHEASAGALLRSVPVLRQLISPGH